MAKKTEKVIEAPIEPVLDNELEEIEDDEIEEIQEIPKKAKKSPMVAPKFENKLDLSPVVDEIKKLNEKLEKKPDDTPPAPKPEPRKYRLFDEFDPTLEG